MRKALEACLVGALACARDEYGSHELLREALPKNQLELGLFLESDRRRSLAITKENLDNQRA